VLLGGSAGAMLGAGSVAPKDFDRFNRVLDAYHRGVHIEWLPVPFATMHEVVRSENGGMVDVRSGNLAQGSAANSKDSHNETRTEQQASRAGAAQETLAALVRRHHQRTRREPEEAHAPTSVASSSDSRQALAWTWAVRDRYRWWC